MQRSPRVSSALWILGGIATGVATLAILSRREPDSPYRIEPMARPVEATRPAVSLPSEWHREVVDQLRDPSVLFASLLSSVIAVAIYYFHFFPIDLDRINVGSFVTLVLGHSSPFDTLQIVASSINQAIIELTDPAKLRDNQWGNGWDFWGDHIQYLVVPGLVQIAAWHAKRALTRWKSQVHERLFPILSGCIGVALVAAPAVLTAWQLGAQPLLAGLFAVGAAQLYLAVTCADLLVMAKAQVWPTFDELASEPTIGAGLLLVVGAVCLCYLFVEVGPSLYLAANTDSFPVLEFAVSAVIVFAAARFLTRPIAVTGKDTGGGNQGTVPFRRYLRRFAVGLLAFVFVSRGYLLLAAAGPSLPFFDQGSQQVINASVASWAVYTDFAPYVVLLAVCFMPQILASFRFLLVMALPLVGLFLYSMTAYAVAAHGYFEGFVPLVPEIGDGYTATFPIYYQQYIHMFVPTHWSGWDLLTRPNVLFTVSTTVRFSGIPQDPAIPYLQRVDAALATAVAIGVIGMVICAVYVVLGVVIRLVGWARRSSRGDTTKKSSPIPEPL